MKISNLLVEARKRLFVGKKLVNDTEYIIFSTSRSSTPFLIVGPDGEKFTTIELTKKAKDILRKNITFMGDDDYNDHQNYLIYFRIGSIRDNFSDRPDLFEINQVNLQELYKIMTVKHRIYDSYFRIFEDIPETIDSISVKNNKLLLPDGSNKKTTKLATDTINQLYDILNPFGLTTMMDGVFRFVRIGGTRVGEYQFDTKTVTISIPELRKQRSISVLIHEIGHKWHDQKKLDDAIKEKYSEIIRKGHEFNVNVSGINEGDIVEYVGDQKKFRGDYKVTEINKNLKKVKVGTKMEDKIVYMTVPFNMMIHFEKQGEPISVTSTDIWFPTNYSTTNHFELFAELFVEYIRGNCDPEVCEWFDSLSR